MKIDIKVNDNALFVVIFVVFMVLMLAGIFSTTAKAGLFDPPTKQEQLQEHKQACESGLMRIIAGCKPVVLFEAMNTEHNCLSHALVAADWMHENRGYSYDAMHIIVGKTNGDPEGDNHAFLEVRVGTKDWAVDQGGLGVWWNTHDPVCPENVCLAAEAVYSMPRAQMWSWPYARAVDHRQRSERGEELPE